MATGLEGTPSILKSGQSQRYDLRGRSVTFADETAHNANLRISSRLIPSSSSMDEEQASTDTGVIELSEYGLCYRFAKSAAAQNTSLPVKSKLVYMNKCRRSELTQHDNSSQDFVNILIIGDFVHGDNIKNQLESNLKLSVTVLLSSAPKKADIAVADFILILLPLEVPGGCHKAMTSLKRVLSLRTDGALCCALVAVSLSLGCDRRVVELSTIHTLLLKHKLSYYVWCNANPASWEITTARILTEVTSCTRHRGLLPRSVLTSMLWFSDSHSFHLQQYLDQEHNADLET